ncbi:hypothetical protein D3C86_1535950 [compost metagenome]
MGVKPRLVVLRKEVTWRKWCAAHHRNAERHHTPKSIRPKHCRLPRNSCTPIVSDDDSFAFAEYANERNKIADNVERRVLPDTFGAVAQPISAQVWRDSVKTGLRQCCELMPPSMRCLWKPMAKQHQGPLALLCDMQSDAIGFNKAVTVGAHVGSVIWSFTALIALA